MRGLLAALRFLTILPIPGTLGTDEKALAVSRPWFPVVGLLIGLAAAGLIYLTAPFLPSGIAVVLAIILLLAASGALHMDGVADCADGFFSSRPREQMLEIMRDSRIGAMGVVAIVVILMSKAAALAAVPIDRFWQPVLLMPIAGRSALNVMMWILPYARPEGGLATVFYRGGSWISGLWAVFFLFGAAFYIAGPAGLWSVVAVLVTILIFSWYCHHKINGATGDTLGAACELAETALALSFAIFLF